MKSALLYGPSEFKIEEVTVPEPGPGEILVKVDTALTCGTDLKVLLRGGHPRMITPPAPFGHEFAGVVEKTGPGVDFFRKGMRVAAANSAPCGRCFFCKRSEENLCDDLIFLNGAYSEFIKIPARIVEKNLLLVPEGLPLASAALTEPLACVLHGVEKAGIRRGDTVAVNGAGPVGLLLVQAVRLGGAFAVSTDTDDNRRALARQAGAAAVIDASGGNTAEKVREAAGGGVDSAFDATGLPSVWEECIGMVRKGGTVVFFGGCAPGTEIRVDTCLAHYSEITMKGVFHHKPVYVEKAMRLLSEGAVAAEPVITGELPLSRLAEAFDMMLRRKSAKIAIKP